LTIETEIFTRETVTLAKTELKFDWLAYKQ